MGLDNEERGLVSKSITSPPSHINTKNYDVGFVWKRRKRGGIRLD